ncbi:hypothetical protein ACWC0C_44395 [Streptomyces sp. NPDC001709]
MYVTAVDEDGEPKSLPVVSERARAKLNGIAAKMTRLPKQKARPLAQLRAWWKASAILTSGVAVDVINSFHEYARAAAVAIRARVAAVVDIALAVVDVAAMVFVMDGGWFHRRHLLAEARRHLALVLRGRRREPGLDDAIVDAVIATCCLDISEPRTLRSRMPAFRLCAAGWSLAGLESARRPPAAAPVRQPPAARAHQPRPGLRTWSRGSGGYPGSRCSTSGPSSPVRWSARSCAPPSPPCGVGRTASSRTSRRRCPSSCSRPDCRPRARREGCRYRFAWIRVTQWRIRLHDAFT